MCPGGFGVASSVSARSSLLSRCLSIKVRAVSAGNVCGVRTCIYVVFHTGCGVIKGCESVVNVPLSQQQEQNVECADEVAPPYSSSL